MPREGKYWSPALPRIWKKLVTEMLENPEIQREIQRRGWTVNETGAVKLAVYKLLEGNHTP